MALGNRSFWAGVLLSGCTIVSVGLYASGKSGDQGSAPGGMMGGVNTNVSAKSFTLLDSAGKPRLTMKMVDGKSPALDLFDAQGVKIGSLGQTTKGGAALRLGHKRNGPQSDTGTVLLNADEDGGDVQVQGPTNDSGIVLIGSKNESLGSSIVFSGADGKVTKVMQYSK